MCYPSQKCGSKCPARGPHEAPSGQCIRPLWVIRAAPLEMANHLKVCFAPFATAIIGRRKCRRWANSCLSTCSDVYSIITSARKSSEARPLSPISLGVFRFTSVSYLVGACSGSSAVASFDHLIRDR
jgi:hypothetical protein